MNNRSLATRRVMKTIARRTNDAPLPYQADDGSWPLVVALLDDSLSAVGQIVREQFRGRANVFVPFTDHIALIDFEVGHDDAVDADQQRAHENTSMAMYVAFLRMNHGSAKLTVPMSSANVADVQDIAYAF